MSSGFKQYYTEEGVPYYFDASTGRSIWAAPTDWVAQYDNYGGICFANTVTGDIVPAASTQMGGPGASHLAAPPDETSMPAMYSDESFYPSDTGHADHMSPQKYNAPHAHPHPSPLHYQAIPAPTPVRVAPPLAYMPPPAIHRAYSSPPLASPGYVAHAQHPYTPYVSSSRYLHPHPLHSGFSEDEGFGVHHIHRSHSEGSRSDRRDRRRKAEKTIIESRLRSSTAGWTHGSGRRDGTARRSGSAARRSSRRQRANSSPFYSDAPSSGVSDDEPWYAGPMPSFLDFLGCGARGAPKTPIKREHSAVAPSDVETGEALAAAGIQDHEIDEFAKRFVGLTLEQRTAWLGSTLSKFGGSVIEKVQYVALYLTAQSVPFVAKFLRAAASSSAESWRFISSVADAAMTTISPKHELPKYIPQGPTLPSNKLDESDSDAFLSALSGPNTADASLVEERGNAADKLFSPAVVQQLLSPVNGGSSRHHSLAASSSGPPLDADALARQVESIRLTESNVLLETPPRWPPAPPQPTTPSQLAPPQPTTPSQLAQEVDVAANAWFLQMPSGASVAPSFMMSQYTAPADEVVAHEDAIPEINSADAHATGAVQLEPLVLNAPSEAVTGVEPSPDAISPILPQNEPAPTAEDNAVVN